MDNLYIVYPTELCKFSHCLKLICFRF